MEQVIVFCQTQELRQQISLLQLRTLDELNLLCCLIAKKAGRCETVARVRNPVYYDEISFIKEEMGISVVLNPELSAAYEIARLLRFPFCNGSECFLKAGSRC